MRQVYNAGVNFEAMLVTKTSYRVDSLSKREIKKRKQNKKTNPYNGS